MAANRGSRQKRTSQPSQPAGEQTSQPGNGLPPGFRTSLVAKAIAAGISEQLGPFLSAIPGALAGSLAQVIATTPAKTPPCAACVVRRVTWEDKYKGVVADAEAAAQAAYASIQDMLKTAAEREETLDPETLPSQNPADYMPEHLRPHESLPFFKDHLPSVMDGLTPVGGTWFCMYDLPGVPAMAEDGNPAPAQPAQPTPPRDQILLAPPGMSVTAAAKAARQNQPGMPGYAEK